MFSEFHFVFNNIKEIPRNPKDVCFVKEEWIHLEMFTADWNPGGLASKPMFITSYPDVCAFPGLSPIPLPGQGNPPFSQGSLWGTQLLPSHLARPKKALSRVPGSGPMSEYKTPCTS